jgi:hypothetical protein
MANVVFEWARTKMPTRKKHTAAERQRVLDAFNSGDENWLGVAEVKAYVQANRHLLSCTEQGESLEKRKQSLLKEAANYALLSITPNLVINEEIHCADWWERALNGEDMRLGE